MSATTIHIPPYGKLNIPVGKSVGVFSGNVPHVHLVTGSDAIRLAMGQCVDVDCNYMAIANPFPRQATMTLVRGEPTRFEAEASAYSLYQSEAIQSFGSYFKPAETTGQKWAVGMMMRRGTAVCEFIDGTADGFSSVMIFPGARKDFLSFKPAGCMDEGFALRSFAGEVDDSVIAVSGRYTDAHVAAWIAAAGYAGQITTGPNMSTLNGWTRWRVATDAAVFFTRAADKNVTGGVRLWHNGADLVEWM